MNYQDLKNAYPQSRPVLILDEEAFFKNVHWAISEAGDKKIRVATKSLRSVEMIRKVLSSHSTFQGLMTFSLEESLWLRDLGFKDILLGYPMTDAELLRRLADDPSEITLMVDRVEHLELLEAAAEGTNSVFNVCIDVDLSLDLPGLRFGVYRSHLHREKQLDVLLTFLETCTHVRVQGLMGYEAQIAGVTDDDSRVIRTLKDISLLQLRKRRQKMVELLRKRGHELLFVNGGGTGSLKLTRDEKVVTEITLGSAFYAPVLFDHYQDFKLSPALVFGLPIVRRPTPEIVTVLGGGYIASGELSPLKQPQPFLPEGLVSLKHEGFGEVQTPLSGKGALGLKTGDLVFFRHAKAGEICERFNEISIYRSGKKEETLKTYRGEGKCFL